MLSKAKPVYSFVDDYEQEKNIVIIPVRNFDISEKYRINDITIYPSNSINRKELSEAKLDFHFSELANEFFDSALVVFPIGIHKGNPFRNFTPEEKENILNSNFSKADDILNIFKYIFCNLDKTSLLMQRSGYINNTYSGMLIYYPNLKMCDFLKDKYRVNNEFIGRGLVVNISETRELLNRYMCILKEDCNEIGNIVKQALRLYSLIILQINISNP
jgi:hypothetical protein